MLKLMHVYIKRTY